MTRAWIALGGNLGDREKIFGQALGLLSEAPGIHLRRGSAVYETPPWGPAGQERYWNAVVEVDTELEPDVLLAACLGVEESLGRVREVRWGPRNIDLDLLLYGDRHWRSDRLVIPHPRMTERAFVLRPLADLIPEREVGGKSILNWLKESSEEGIERVRDSVLSCQ